MAYQLTDFENHDLSVAMTADIDRALGVHLHKPDDQEDLSFAYWRPSVGATRYTAIIGTVIWPSDEDRRLDGNVSFRRTPPAMFAAVASANSVRSSQTERGLLFR